MNENHRILLFSVLHIFCSFSAKAQKIEMDKLEKAKKERTKVPIQNLKRYRCRASVLSLLHFNLLLCYFCAGTACFIPDLSFFPACLFSQTAQIKLFALPFISCLFHGFPAVFSVFLNQSSKNGIQ